VKILEQSSRRVLTITTVAALLVASAFVVAARPVVASSSATPLGMAIPLYTYPTDGTWTQVIQAKQAYPNVPIVAVINPDSGPGSSQDPNYVQGIKQLQAAGVLVYGYVDTAYGSDSISSVESHVNQYVSWYKVNGILFDDMQNVAGYASYYSTLGSYVSSLGIRSMGNPGTSVDLSLIGTLNALCVYEDTGLPAISFITYPGYSPTNFAVIALGVSLNTSFLSSIHGLVSWVYLTNYSGSNPYDVLPTYFTSEMSALSALDGVTTTTSSTSHSTTSSSTTTTSTSTTKTTTTTTSSSPNSISFLTVDSVDLSGNPISGLWTTWNQGSKVLDTGYTPMAFKGTNGETYTATVANYKNYVFCHWSDGATGSARTVTLKSGQTITAVYSTTGSCPPPTAKITVRSLTLSGGEFTGMWLTVTSGGKLVASGYTSLTFSANMGQKYSVTMSNYQNYVFAHWENGSTNPVMTFTVTGAETLSASYNT
jgi:hypothetical protein